MPKRPSSSPSASPSSSPSSPAPKPAAARKPAAAPKPAPAAAAAPLAELILATPIGPLLLVADDRALRTVYFPNHPDGPLLRASADPTAPPRKTAPIAHPILREAARQLDEYFSGERRDFDLPLDPGGTEFQQRVWNKLCEIPFATTWSYGALAAECGNPNASRAVGAANGKNPIPVIVPCHRVIGSNGALTGFGGGEPTKRWLLDHEAKVAGLRLF